MARGFGRQWHYCQLRATTSLQGLRAEPGERLNVAQPSDFVGMEAMNAGV